MFETIIAHLSTLFKSTDKGSQYQSDLEKFIISKSPQTTCDVEHWINEFDRQQSKRGW